MTPSDKGEVGCLGVTRRLPFWAQRGFLGLIVRVPDAYSHTKPPLGRWLQGSPLSNSKNEIHGELLSLERVLLWIHGWEVKEGDGDP